MNERWEHRRLQNNIKKKTKDVSGYNRTPLLDTMMSGLYTLITLVSEGTARARAVATTCDVCYQIRTEIEECGLKYIQVECTFSVQRCARL